jgi:hypothetical protein
VAAAGGGGVPLAGAGGAAGPALPAQNLAAPRRGGCAIDLAGNLQCWGVGPDTGAAWPAMPAGPFVSVIGESFVCARRGTGELACLLPPDTNESLSFLPTGPFASVAGHGFELCGLDASGSATCYVPMRQPTAYPGSFEQVSVGDDFRCGITESDQSIQCWGSDHGPYHCTGNTAVGQLMAPSGTFVQVASGGLTSCAIRSDGTLACWGAGTLQQDPPDLDCGANPTHYGQALPPSGTFKQVSVGSYHACAVRTDGTLACWGAGQSDADCEGGNIDLCGQAQPPAGIFDQVAAGWSHSCAMRADRTLACWGASGDGKTMPPSGFPNQ